MLVGVVEGTSQRLAYPVLVSIVDVARVVDFEQHVCVGDVEMKGRFWG